MFVTNTDGGKGIYIDESGAEHIKIVRMSDGKVYDCTKDLATSTAITFQRASSIETPADDYDGGVHYGLGKSRRGTCTASVNPDSLLDKSFRYFRQQLEQYDQTREQAMKGLFKILYNNDATGEWLKADGCVVQNLSQKNVTNQNGGASPVSVNMDVTELTDRQVIDDELSFS